MFHSPQIALLDISCCTWFHDAVEKKLPEPHRKWESNWAGWRGHTKGISAHTLIKMQFHYFSCKKKKNFSSSQPAQKQEALSHGAQMSAQLWRLFMLTWGGMQPESLPRSGSVSCLSLLMLPLPSLLSGDCRDFCLWSTSSCPAEPSRITGKSPPFWTWWRALWSSQDLSLSSPGQRGRPIIQVKYKLTFCCLFRWSHLQY